MYYAYVRSPTPSTEQEKQSRRTRQELLFPLLISFPPSLSLSAAPLSRVAIFTRSLDKAAHVRHTSLYSKGGPLPPPFFLFSSHSSHRQLCHRPSPDAPCSKAQLTFALPAWQAQPCPQCRALLQ